MNLSANLSTTVFHQFGQVKVPWTGSTNGLQLKETSLQRKRNSPIHADPDLQRPCTVQSHDTGVGRQVAHYSPLSNRCNSHIQTSQACQ
eukprot:m.454308 g.454308  ORF g.454308 m.454308 type:complete len:89 (+) comp20646_c0_seq1:88-354(+)